MLGRKAVIFQIVLPVCLEIFVSAFDSFIIYPTNIYLYLLFAGISDEQDRSWENV